MEREGGREGEGGEGREQRRSRDGEREGGGREGGRERGGGKRTEKSERLTEERRERKRERGEGWKGRNTEQNSNRKKIPQCNYAQRCKDIARVSCRCINDRLLGRVVKVSASRTADPGFDCPRGTW